MVRIKLKVYWRSASFSTLVIKVAKSFNKHPRYFRMIDQLIKSVTSISANLIESQSARSNKEFISIHEIALREAKETFHWLKQIEDLGIGDKVNLNKLQDENTQIIKMISSIVLTSKKKYGDKSF